MYKETLPLKSSGLYNGLRCSKALSVGYLALNTPLRIQHSSKKATKFRRPQHAGEQNLS